MKKNKKKPGEKDNTSFLEINPGIYKEQALKALEKAKKLEKEQLKEGKRSVRLDRKTIVLR